MVQSICRFLKSISDIGALYGNLRTENILLMLNRQQTKIISMKYLSFGTLVAIEDSEKMLYPD